MELKTLQDKIIEEEDTSSLPDSHPHNDATQNDASSSFEEPAKIIYTSHKTRNKATKFFSFLSSSTKFKHLQRLTAKLKSQAHNSYLAYTKQNAKTQFYISLLSTVTLLSFLSKLILTYKIWKHLFNNVSTLYAYIHFLLNNNIYSPVLFYINFLFLIIGLLLFTSTPFIEVFVRLRFITNCKEHSLITLILNKLLFFICLGLIPEVAMTMFEFKNKKNVLIPFYVCKLYFQPALLGIIIVYACAYVKTYAQGGNLFEKANKHYLICLYLYRMLKKNKAFMWNGFNIEKEEKEGKVSGSGEAVVNNPIVIIKKKHIAISVLVAFLISPVLNGLFGYGYYVFFFRDKLTCWLFQADVVVTVVIGILLIKMLD